MKRSLRRATLFFTVSACAAGPAAAQTSSIGARQRETQAGTVQPSPTREEPAVRRNVTYEKYSWIGLPARVPKTFKVGDLITIVVREQREFKADADLETEKKFDVSSQLDAFLKGTAGGLGAAAFRRGKPNIDYQFDTKLESSGDTERKDRMTTRVTAQIIDVKPNGVLVLEAKARIAHDDETSMITLTGSCRKEDVTADNTVLSTQLADKTVVVDNQGALRSATTRGWIPRLIDWLKPI
jgi:flagellar L-ring protein precursor FlgH